MSNFLLNYSLFYTFIFTYEATEFSLISIAGTKNYIIYHQSTMTMDKNHCCSLLVLYIRITEDGSLVPIIFLVEKGWILRVLKFIICKYTITFM